jgi:hypothetical protein
VYSVEREQFADEQFTALPEEALPFYAELMVVLETAPWSGEPYNMQRPDTNLRTHVFGQHNQGLAITSSSKTSVE